MKTALPTEGFAVLPVFRCLRSAQPETRLVYKVFINGLSPGETCKAEGEAGERVQQGCDFRQSLNLNPQGTLECELYLCVCPNSGEGPGLLYHPPIRHSLRAAPGKHGVLDSSIRLATRAEQLQCPGGHLPE